MTNKKNKTAVQVSFETWKELGSEKLFPSETFEQVIKRLLVAYRKIDWEATIWIPQPSF